MEFKKPFLLLLSFWCVFSFAQQQVVVSPSSNVFENSTGSISFTLGELMIKTFSSPDLVLTQGFHQTKLIIVGIQSNVKQGNDILAYPNPVKDFVTLEIENFHDFSFVLFDMTGRIIQQGEVISTLTEINFNYLEPSIYVLKVLWNNEDVRSFKITKN